MTKVVVVGGGLIGMLTAHELASGGCQVVVVERGHIGREASWAGGGILSPLYPWRYDDAVTALARWSQERYQMLCDELAESTNIDPEWTRSGLLVLNVGADEREEAIMWATRHDYDLEIVRGELLHTIEPSLAAKHEQALWMASVAQLRNPRLLKALRRMLESHGVELREGAEVDGFSSSGSRIEGVELLGGESIDADRVVVTAGSWSGRLLESTGIHLPIEPVLGQMLLFRAVPGLVQHIVLSEGHYVIPRRGGLVVVGSTLEHVGFDKRTTEEGLEELRDAAFALVPELHTCDIERHWAGLRPGSPDGIPFIGEHPDFDGLYINSGHFRNGVVMGLASARVLADLLLGRLPSIDPAPYSLVLR